MKELKTINELNIDWDKKPSHAKLFQIGLLKDLVKILNPNQIFQCQTLCNFKKKVWDSEKSYSFRYFYTKEDSQDLTLISDKYGIIHIFFNRIIFAQTTTKDYLPSSTLIIYSIDKNKLLIVVTEFDFSYSKLRRRFAGYKYLYNESIFKNCKKYCVASSKLTKRDKSFVENNGFKIFQGEKGISKFYSTVKHNLAQKTI